MAVEGNYAIAIAKLRYWPRNVAPVFQPRRSKTKTNHILYAQTFPRFEQLTGDCHEF